jgi:hypothetical protein
MNQPSIFIAAFSLGAAAFATLAPGIGENVQRLTLGLIGILLITLGLYSI